MVQSSWATIPVQADLMQLRHFSQADGATSAATGTGNLKKSKITHLKLEEEKNLLQDFTNELDQMCAQVSKYGKMQHKNTNAQFFKM